MAEHCQNQRIGAGGNAAAAIGNDAPVHRTDRGEPPAQFLGRQEFVRGGIDQMRRRQIDAAGDAAWPPVRIAAGALMLRRLQRIEGTDRAIADCRQNLGLANHQVAFFKDRENGG